MQPAPSAGPAAAKPQAQADDWRVAEGHASDVIDLLSSDDEAAVAETAPADEASAQLRDGFS